MRTQLLVLSFVALAACGDAPSDLLGATAPVALDDALAYLDTTNASLVIIDPAASAGPGSNRRYVRIPVGEAPVSAYSVPRPDDPLRRQLVIMDPAGDQVIIVHDKTGRSTTLDVGVPLEALDVSPDGRYAIAYQPDGATPSNSLFIFPNSVAVIDLDPENAHATPLLLGSANARPLRAAFADSVRLTSTVSVDGQPMQVTASVPLALVFIEGGIVPVDLAKAAVGPMLPLTSLAGGDVVPAEVLFTNNRGDLLSGTLDGLERAFVRTTDGELYVFAIVLSGARLIDDPARMDVVVALENVVTPDATIEDVELFFDKNGKELLLAAAGREVILVDGYTGVASRFSQNLHVERLLRFADPLSGTPLALGYAVTAQQTALLRLDPVLLDMRRGDGIDVVAAGGPIAAAAIAGSGSRVVFAYADERDIGVLELSAGSEVRPLRAASRIAARRVSDVGDRLWAVTAATFDGGTYLAEIDLGAGLSWRDVRLDAAGIAVGQAGRFVWVAHPDSAGSVTFFPDDDLRREAAVAFRGVLFYDLLEIEVPTTLGAAQGGE